MLIYRTFAVTGQLLAASRDPHHGAALLEMLRTGSGGELVSAYLADSAGTLTTQLRSDASLQISAREHARAWGGSGYDERVKHAATARGEAIADRTVLLAAAVAAITIAGGPVSKR